MLCALRLNEKLSFGDSAGHSLQTDTAGAADRSFRADEHTGASVGLAWWMRSTWLSVEGGKKKDGNPKNEEVHQEAG